MTTPNFVTQSTSTRATVYNVNGDNISIIYATIYFHAPEGMSGLFSFLSVHILCLAHELNANANATLLAGAPPDAQAPQTRVSGAAGVQTIQVSISFI